MSETTRYPEGWRVVKFGDVVTCVNRATRDPIADGLDRIVGLNHLDAESLSLQRWDLLEDMPDGTSFTRTFLAGHVLFGKRRAYQRKVAVPDFDGICSGDILVFEVSSTEMLQKFLPFIVQSNGFFEHALGTSAGSLSPRTKWRELAKYEFALPPVDDQLRIVTVLDAISECIDLSSITLNKIAALQSAIFNDGILIATRVPLGSFLELLTKGTTPTSLGMSFCDEGISFLKAENVNDGKISLASRTYISPATHSSLSRSVLARGDVLLTIAGTIGRTAVVTPEALPANCNQAVAILRPKDVVDSIYLSQWLSSTDAREQIRSRQRSNTISNLSLGMISALQFPLLSLDSQAELVAYLRSAGDLVIRITEQRNQLRLLRTQVRQVLLEGSVQ